MLVPEWAAAQRETTREALERMEEVLAMRLEDGGFTPQSMVPAIVVALRPQYEESVRGYPTAALTSLSSVFGSDGLRLCEACMAPRLFVTDGFLEQNSSDISIAEIIRLDEALRNSSAPAKTAIWLDETTSGVALRVIELKNARIVLAENIDPTLSEQARTERNYTLARELDRRARGDSITQIFVDATMYPGQHFSIDWTEQWGDTNTNLSGLTISLFDPVVGIGGAYYRAIPDARNLLVGGKVIMSVPTALVRALTSEDVNILDRLLTGVFVVRFPFGRSNYGLELTASTNGRVGVGISLLNTSLLPVLP